MAQFQSDMVLKFLLRALSQGQGGKYAQTGKNRTVTVCIENPKTLQKNYC